MEKTQINEIVISASNKQKGSVMKNENFILCKDLKIMTNKEIAGQNIFCSRELFDDVTDKQGHKMVET